MLAMNAGLVALGKADVSIRSDLDETQGAFSLAFILTGSFLNFP